MKQTNMGRPVKNRFKVPMKQWRKWKSPAQKVFNQMMLSMRPSMQFAFLHTQAVAVKKEHWEVTRWNAAWTAAEIVQKGTYLGKVSGVPRAK